MKNIIWEVLWIMDGEEVFAFILFVILLLGSGVFLGGLFFEPDKVTYKDQKCLVHEKVLYCEEKESHLEFEWSN